VQYGRGILLLRHNHNEQALPLQKNMQTSPQPNMTFCVIYDQQLEKLIDYQSVSSR
jgi:hypothetical protein